MQEKNIPAFTMLLAGAVVSIFCIVKKVDTLYALKLLLGMLILFYIIGLFVKRMVVKINKEANQRIADEKAETEHSEEQQEEASEEIDAENSQEMDE